MRIKMLVPMAGPSIVWKKGDVVDVAEAEGKRLVARGFAEINIANRPGVGPALFENTQTAGSLLSRVFSMFKSENT